MSAPRRVEVGRVEVGRVEVGRVEVGRVDAYLRRIGWSGPISHDYATLAALQLAHLQTVPFEALEVFAGRKVRVDDEWVWSKVVDRQRGGWCFEANGAFALLLEALGFHVRRLGAAVLLAGPAVVIDHLVLEVQLDRPYLVEVGFGDRSPVTPLPLDDAGPHESPSGLFEFLPSPQGTTLAEVVDDVPHALYRFKRVNLSADDFAGASERLSTDRSLSWSTSPFATRLLDAETRLTLSRRSLKTSGPNGTTRRAVPPAEWNRVLADEFGIAESFPPDVFVV